MALSVAILAGGLATRLKPITETIPKSLVDVNGEPFIVHQLRLLKENGIGDVVICSGFLSHMLEEFCGDGSKYGMRIRFSPDGPKLLGTAGALKRALPLLGETFFVLYGDSYLDCDYKAVESFFVNSRKQALMTVFRNEGKWENSNVEFAGGRLIVYDKKNRTSAMRHTDYGLNAFRRTAFDAVPEGQPCDLVTLYQELLARGEVAAFEIHKRFYEMGSFTGLEELREYLKIRIANSGQ